MAEQDKNIVIQRFKDVMGSSTQKQFADKLHTTQTTISKILNGLADPSLAILTEISKDYGISVDWLLGLSEEKYIQNISVHKLTYPYVISVFRELLQNGNITFELATRDESECITDVECDRLYGYKHKCSLVLKDVVLKELVRKMASDLRISVKAATSKDSYDEFKEILDWNDQSVRARFALYNFENNESLLEVYQRALERNTDILPDLHLAAPTLEEFLKDKPVVE